MAPLPAKRHELIREEIGEVKTIVVLVHGTFAPAAPWTLPGSRLREALARELKGQSVGYCRFVWQGRWIARLNNSHGDRLLSGKILADHLRQLACEQPETKFVLIGHSHGGNVIFYALDDLELRERVLAVVTIATPFPRHGAKKLSTILLPIHLVVWLPTAIAVTVASIHLADALGLLDQWWWHIPLWLAMGTAVYLPFHPLIKRLHRLAARWSSRAKRRTAALTVRPPASVPVFIAYGTHDEAREWLEIGGSAQEALETLIGFVGMSTHLLGLVFGALAGAAAFGVLGAVAGAVIGYFALSLVVLPLVAALWVGLALPAIILTKTTRDNPLVHGSLGPLCGLVGTIRTDKLPVVRPAHRGSKTSDYIPKKRLAHSLYELPLFCQESAAWVRARLATPSR